MNFQQDWFTKKEFSLEAPHRGIPGSLMGVGVHILRYDSNSVHNFQTCTPGENFSKILPKIKDLA